MPRLRSRSRDGRVARMQPPGWRGGSPGPLGRQDDCRGSASRERNHGVGDHPIPFRTRQLSSPSSMILRILTWESRTTPRLYFQRAVFVRRPVVFLSCRQSCIPLRNSQSRNPPPSPFFSSALPSLLLLLGFPPTRSSSLYGFRASSLLFASSASSKKKC